MATTSIGVLEPLLNGALWFRWCSVPGVMDRATEPPGDEARGGWELLVEAKLRRGRMRRDLAGAMRSAIQEGRLAAGTVLPASRRLAAQVGVSRGVVSDAYDQLASEGYLRVAPRAAPVVSAVAGVPPPTTETPAASWRYDFNPVTPEVALFPRRGWARAVDRALRQAPDAALDYGDHRGRPELRAALAAYLARVRGARADPGQIIITQGFTQALSLICQVVAASGRATVAVETPSHPGLWETVRRAGLRLAGCPVDADGLNPATLADLEADAVVAAPAHQFPTGAPTSPPPPRPWPLRCGWAGSPPPPGWPASCRKPNLRPTLDPRPSASLPSPA